MERHDGRDVQATSSERTEYRYRGPRHLLVLFEHGVRREGETSSRACRLLAPRPDAKLIFVPAGTEYRDWHEARSAARMVLFYFDPEAIPLLEADA